MQHLDNSIANDFELQEFDPDPCVFIYSPPREEGDKDVNQFPSHSNGSPSGGVHFEQLPGEKGRFICLMKLVAFRYDPATNIHIPRYFFFDGWRFFMQRYDEDMLTIDDYMLVDEVMYIPCTLDQWKTVWFYKRW